MCPTCSALPRPVEEIAALLDEKGVPLILDASQSAGLIDIDVRRHPCLAAVCMPGHKALYGPQGTGILLALDDRIAARRCFTGGTGSRSEEMRQPDFLPDALESGTPNVPGIAGLAAGIAFVRAVGPANILAHERKLVREFARALEGESRITCFAHPAQTGVLSLTRAAARRWRTSRRRSRGRALRCGRGCTARRSPTAPRAPRRPARCVFRSRFTRPRTSSSTLRRSCCKP